MAFHAIAYGPDEQCLLTIDGSELLAYDAQTEAPKWRVSFAKLLVSTVFVDTNALPSNLGGGGGGPFRSQSTLRAAVALDIEGRMHVVDIALGQPLGDVAPMAGAVLASAYSAGSAGNDKPTKAIALASSAASNMVALVIDDRVIVWRSGERNEVSVRGVSALAFSNDGSTLAIGTDKGELRTYYVAAIDLKAPFEQTFSQQGLGVISDLAQHPNGTWLVSGSHGVYSVNAKGSTRQDRISSSVQRMTLDPRGSRLAIQRSDRAVVIYDWPKLSVAMRIEYTDRPIRGLAFGPDNWFGAALDHGDANKIDVETSLVHRTDTHAGRTHRSWTLMVEGKKEMLSAKEAREAEERNRVKAPEAKPTGGFGAGGRLGIGAMISFALIGIRVCVRAGSSSSSSYSGYNYSIPTIKAPSKCDRACASDRIQQLRTECTTANLEECVTEAKAADEALTAGQCTEAKAALKRIKIDETTRSKSVLASSYHILAEFGLNEACAAGAIQPRIIKHAQLVHLKKSDLIPPSSPPSPATNGDPTPSPLEEERSREIEKLPEMNVMGETPRSVWAASDGAVFVATSATTTSTNERCLVYRQRPGSGAPSRDNKNDANDSKSPKANRAPWDVIYNDACVGNHLALFGKSSSDVYLVAGDVLHFDGKSWKKVRSSLSNITSAAVSGSDILVAGHSYASADVDSSGQIQRALIGKAQSDDVVWAKESTPRDLSFSATQLVAGGPGLWATVEDTSSNHLLFQRTGTVWTNKPIVRNGGTGSNGSNGSGAIDGGGGVLTTTIRAVWVSPTGDAVFVASDDSVYRSNNNGATWIEVTAPRAIYSFWGRSSSDLYAGTYGGILHYDGKTWSWTRYTGQVEAMAGTATELLVVRAE